MHPRRAAAGFALASAGQLAYVFMMMTTGDTALSFVTSFVLIAALGVAALALNLGQRALLAGALAVAFAAQAVSFLPALGRGFALTLAPTLIGTVGYGMMAWAARPASGHEFGVRAGAAVAAVGASLWIVLEPGVNGWLPGNLLVIGGFLLVAGTFRGQRAAVSVSAEA